jgi:hypothetical protein
MRSLRFSRFNVLTHSVITLLAATLFSSCASPRRSAIHYSAPSVAPIRQNISSAKAHAAAEGIAAGAAGVAIARAQSLYSSHESHPSESSADLQESLGEASGQINTLITENGALRPALDAAEANITTLETKVGSQTDSLNTCGDEKNLAIDRADKATHRYHKLKFLMCTLAAAAAGLLVFQFRNLLLLLGPYGFAAYAVVPGIVFAALWLRL